ncbi:hypothetical protein JTE90_026292 [Oedothorax gibbosus]|uniref:Cytochrome c oxidase assembly factor 5 n=1 Tax=Oedothorax gibbosus TaxID=931172 RepID=A0AAV6U305_9ARAC|nr:hypothetical protein JTE90_026292 [Oedothorax gibbosus]
MPIYDEDRDLTKTNSTPCSGVREDLLICLQSSDCVKLHHKSPKECLKLRDPSVPNECFTLKTLLFECKRSLLDNRQRFRGRKGY